MWSVTLHIKGGGALTYSNIDARDSADAIALARMMARRDEPYQRIKKAEATKQ